jgi:tetratricopeptide (TPR) repeat protein
MDAAISGRAGVAVLIDGKALFSFDVDEPHDLVPRETYEARLLLSEARDLQVFENVTHDDVIPALDRAFKSACALDLALIMLDAELSDDCRIEAADDLEALIRDSDIRIRVENVMYARSLPKGGDIAGALDCALFAGRARVLEFLQSLDANQSAIRAVCGSWDAIDARMFGADDAKRDFMGSAVNRGIFRFMALAAADTSMLGQAQIMALRDPQFNGFANRITIFKEWFGSVRREIPDARSRRQEREGLESEEPDVDMVTRRGRSKHFDRGAVLAKVDSQKELIVEMMRTRNSTRVDALLDELTTYQLEFGGARFLVKTLCDLAMQAKDIENYRFQLELTTRAVEIEPTDAWSWAQHGDALLNNDRPGEALTAYAHAEDFGAGAVAKNGRAEILKALGRLQEALAAYEEVIQEHPGDVFAKSGRGEILKALGRLPEALAAYGEVIEEHPGDVVAKTGRAEVLKALGRLSEALVAYDEATEQHAESVVAKNGRAEVLKALGRLPEALAAYGEVIEEHPEDVVAKTGRAEVLKALGRLPEALAVYGEVIEEHPEDVVAKNGRAEVLKALGRLPEALVAYDEAIEQHAESVVAKSGRAEVLKALGRLPEALVAYDEAIEQHAESVVAKNGRAEVLKSLGRLPEALAAYGEAIEEHPEDVVAKNGCAEVLKALGRLPEALAAYGEAIEEHPGDVVAKSGRAEILKALGRLPEALAAYGEVIEEHPGDVVARNGRAEVLKALGRLPEAVLAYEDTIRQHPHDLVARNGRACVLASLGRYDEALASLPADNLVDVQDWIGFHMRGMILLRRGTVPEAIEVFEYGLKNDPWLAHTELFSSGLSLALIRSRNLEDAEKVLDGIKAPEFRPSAAVLRLHVCGELNKREKAAGAYEELLTYPFSVASELRDELHLRYVLHRPPKHDDQWIITQEIDLGLETATQYSMALAA